MAREIRIAFITDLHGIKTVFKKAIQKVRSIEPDFLIIGGDLLGRPLLLDKVGDSYYFKGEEVDPTELLGLSSEMGFYIGVKGRDDELELLRREGEKQLNEWLEESKGLNCYWSVGHSDPPFVEDFFTQRGMTPQGNVIMTSNYVSGMTLVSLGLTNNFTPEDGKNYREAPDYLIYNKGKELLEKAEPPVVINFHVPPLDTNLDKFNKRHVGSKAVRDLLREFKPVLSLHGHVHGSAAVDVVGGVTAVNASPSEDMKFKLALITISREVKGIVPIFKVNDVKFLKI
ncbi:putative phosphoesterase, ICC [Metallosphaera yellowstonensis MK1]|uniref:Putative phosphoesterase, ICC n=1 Tax=Metallosphaera yellowstonensis MK1 TaxID=671065 RepID=H2C7A6_9CREN|nr:metallophosphoesterase [Metallosphaera yellowstonensis]EHP68032.1 putative phosphoesterase, ICC [Metallosphaera yellowstonensis MK1]